MRSCAQSRLNIILLWCISTSGSVIRTETSGTSHLLTQPSNNIHALKSIDGLRQEEPEVMHLRAIKSNPKAPEPLYKYASFLLRDNRRDAATRCLLEALQIEPRHVDSLCGYAIVLFQDGDPRAERLFRSALEIGGPSALVRDSAAVIYSRILCRLDFTTRPHCANQKALPHCSAGKVQEAASMLFSVIESTRFDASMPQDRSQLDVSMADIFCEYGNLLEGGGGGGGGVGRTEEAEDAFLAALERNPDHAGTLRSYALLLDRSGRCDETGDPFAAQAARGRTCAYAGVW